MSESKRTFKLQLLPIVDTIIINNLDGETTANDILDKYAAATAKKFDFKERDIRDSLDQIIPFTPVGPAPDNYVGVGQGVVQTTRLKNMYRGMQNHDEINKGLCLVSVSVQHPHFNLVQLYGKGQQRIAMLEAKMADVEKAMTAPLQASSNMDQPDKPKKSKKKKRSKATTSGPSGIGNTADDGLAPDDGDEPNTPTDPIASTLAGTSRLTEKKKMSSVDDDTKDTSTLLGMLESLREEMGNERAARKEMEAEQAARKKELEALKKVVAEGKEELEAEQAARKKEMEAERAARKKELEALKKVVHIEKEKNKGLLAEQETMKNQFAAERSERLDQLGEHENRTEELEDWVSTQDPKFLDRIRLRALLDNGQSVLARFIGCSVDPDVSAASMAWRIKLNGSSEQKRSDDERLKAAHDLLSARRNIPDQIRKLMADNNAMRLLTQRSSIIRRQGNEVAHRLVDSSLLRQIAARSLSLSSADKDGMISVLEFVDCYRVF